MWPKKQKTVQGIHVKERAREEIDKDYQENALYLGHKTRVLTCLKQDVERLEAEIGSHLESLLKINKEGLAFAQKEQIKAVAANNAKAAEAPAQPEPPEVA